MKKTMLIATLLSLTACQGQGGAQGDKPGATGSTTAATAGAPQTEEQKTFYALGLSIGRSISVFDMTPQELEFVKAGLGAQVSGQKTDVDLETYGPKLQELARERSVRKATQEKEKSVKFLEEKAKEPGAQKTESGLIYKETQAGTGAQPVASDIVKVHYKGTLSDGKEFDSSFKRGEPTQFPLQGVIKCWTEGLQKMKVGGKAQLTCPSDIAYGDRGAPPNIPGGAALVFDVELIEIVKPPEAPPGGMPGMPGMPGGMGGPPPAGKPGAKPTPPPAPTK
ncbi:FKBP-type peptidyl-prolyl cis-trans isomerase [Corallococcus praedator]|uniref:Peptidyl-prolyl cis-trans isomerase n=1 Tax=Corallococcus praedator TaxID=2316724 RepID=A0ABX9QG05_9BACT|nr:MULTISPECIES: FKBP-type peptidyl-prolyl cis-trans isomerase [Corallococcus]RKH16219.1 FKBP-type peptidyl-prolyl cis-trans isomerase [Corallococcus sp. CA047B]RKH24702.1 FKBP-type peptidyl-prolyl cis-trans isomerase [Corallococcus sp. CA031C]RKI06859.1 FKBP-type peptidyl-prolyl cis-trans isomerase [Corallococcus praedator]